MTGILDMLAFNGNPIASQGLLGSLAGPQGILAGRPRGGLLSALANRQPGQRPFLDFLGRNSSALLGAAAGMQAGRGGGWAGLAQGGQLDRERLQSAQEQQQQAQQDAGVQSFLDTLGLPPPLRELARTNPSVATQIAGQQVQPPAAPNFPNSYDEFLLAQQNPAYAAHLQQDTGQTINVNTGATGTPFGDTVGRQLGEQFVAQREAAQQAVQSLQSTAEARRLLDAGMVTGFGADFLVGLGSALQTIGINIAPDAVANAQAFVATRAQEVGRIIELFGAGTGLSDADREFATKAAAGQITMTEDAIRRILDINERASRNVITSYNQLASQVPEGVSPYSLTIPEPPGNQSPAASAGPPPGAQTATNPQTGERVYLHPATGQWEPY